MVELKWSHHYNFLGGKKSCGIGLPLKGENDITMNSCCKSYAWSTWVSQVQKFFKSFTLLLKWFTSHGIKHPYVLSTSNVQFGGLSEIIQTKQPWYLLDQNVYIFIPCTKGALDLKFLKSAHEQPAFRDDNARSWWVFKTSQLIKLIALLASILTQRLLTLHSRAK